MRGQQERSRSLFSCVYNLIRLGNLLSPELEAA